MKNRQSLYLVITLCAILLITILIVIFYNTNGYKLQLLNTFVIPDLKQSDEDHALIATSDTTLYILNTMDSTRTKSYAFSFDGKLNNNFHLPPDSLYDRPGFDYLWDRNLLFVHDWGDVDHGDHVDFYTPNGKSLYQKSQPAEKCVYTNLAGWKNNLYYTILNGSQGLKKATLGLYKESPQGNRELIQMLYWMKNNDRESHTIFPVRLMVDSNSKNSMAMAYAMKYFIKIHFFKDNKEYQFKVLRNIDFFPWTYFNDAPLNMFIGLNYLVLTTWQPGERFRKISRKAIKSHKNEMTVTSNDMDKINKVYNLHGRCLGILECDDKDSKLVDISNDKMIFFNYITGRVSIYKITVK